VMDEPDLRRQSRAQRKVVKGRCIGHHGRFHCEIPAILQVNPIARGDHSRSAVQVSGAQVLGEALPGKPPHQLVLQLAR